MSCQSCRAKPTTFCTNRKFFIVCTLRVKVLRNIVILRLRIGFARHAYSYGVYVQVYVQWILSFYFFESPRDSSRLFRSFSRFAIRKLGSLNFYFRRQTLILNFGFWIKNFEFSIWKKKSNYAFTITFSTVLFKFGILSSSKVQCV